VVVVTRKTANDFKKRSTFVVLARLHIVLAAERKWTSVLRHLPTPLGLSTSRDVGEKPEGRDS